MPKKQKCWKKIGESKRVGYVHYGRKDSNLVDLSLNRRGVYGEKWTATHFGKGKFFTKTFKTKSQALKFAQSFMKKHNVC